MPGNVSLGCLLGQLNRAMSFDVASTSWATSVGSWSKGVTAVSAYFNSTDTHSSAQGARIEAYSNNLTRSVRVSHRTADDYNGRKFPDVSTHDVATTVWARIGTAAFSGFVAFGVWSTFNTLIPVPFSLALQYIQYDTVISSIGASTALVATIFEMQPGTGSYALYADDVITRVDPITLFPDWTLEQSRALIRAGHDATGGYNRETIWSSFGTWKLPLRFLSDSHAALINWWWKNSFTLALTLDTSDADTTAIVRIVNDQQPIGARSRPYDNLWNGTLMLEAIDKGSLVY